MVVAAVEILAPQRHRASGLEHTFNSKVPYAIVSRRLTVEQSQQIREGMRDGDARRLCDLEPMPMRFYPNSGGSPDTTLASQLLGFVTDDGEGRYGVEQFGQDLLRRIGCRNCGSGRLGRRRSRFRPTVVRSD